MGICFSSLESKEQGMDGGGGVTAHPLTPALGECVDRQTLKLTDWASLVQRETLSQIIKVKRKRE